MVDFPPSSESSPPRRQSLHIEGQQHDSPSPSKQVQIEQPSTSPVQVPQRSSDLVNAANGHVVRSGRSADLAQEGDEDRDEHSLLLGPGKDVEGVDELSPLQSPGSSESWNEEDSRPEMKSSWYLFLLTLAMAGLQIAWSVELSNGSPYLLGLGISKSLLAFVWIAGPLSGTLVQPYVGIKSDRCRSPFGKRRPFMVGGAIATIVSLMALAWTRELVAGVLSIFGVPRDSNGVKTTSIVFAVLMIYILDFAINVIQAAIRAFIVDNAPTHQQDSANAWASRMSGIGNIIGYLFGYVNLANYFWFFGNTQFKVLCLMASLALVLTLAVSCTIRERDPRLEGDPADEEAGVLAFFRKLYHSIRKLPPQIRKVCIVQLFAWIGWFPFLFYITTYIGEIYVEPFFESNPHMTPDEVERTWEHATRIGTFALLVFAITTFAASVILPFVVARSNPFPRSPSRTPMTPGAATPSSPLTPRTTSGSSAIGYNPNIASRRGKLFRFLKCGPTSEAPWFTLRRAWMLSHILFALLTWLTFVVRDTTTATVLVALIGIPWAMTNWAPFALIAAEISKRDAIRRGLIQVRPQDRDGELLARGEDVSEGADQAGVVLGIHNVAIAAPQVIATLVSSAIFKGLQKPRGSPGDDSVAWVLRFGGCAAVVAAWLTRGVEEER